MQGLLFIFNFERCVQVMSTLDDTLLSKNKLQVEENNTLLIFVLSYLQPKINLRPLRQLLTQHKIIFSLQDRLPCLRRKLKTFIKTLKKGKSRYEKRKDQLAKEIETNEEIKARRTKIHRDSDESCINHGRK